jgi:hypothetical protein
MHRTQPAWGSALNQGNGTLDLLLQLDEVVFKAPNGVLCWAMGNTSDEDM